MSTVSLAPRPRLSRAKLGLSILVSVLAVLAAQQASAFSSLANTDGASQANGEKR